MPYRKINAGINTENSGFHHGLRPKIRPHQSSGIGRDSICQARWMPGHQRHRSSIEISNDARNLKAKAMFAQDVPFWGLFWVGMTTGLSLLALLASCFGARFEMRGSSSFDFSLLLGLNRKTLQMKCCYAEDIKGSAPPPIFACPTSLPSTSPPLSFLFPAFALWRAFQSMDLNGLPPSLQPKSTLCFVPFR